MSAMWRYPVKSLGGEPLPEARLTADGVPGDRLVHVRGERGLLTGRTRRRLLTVAGGTGADGAPTVDGDRWTSPAAAAAVRAAAGDDARLVPWSGPERFDVLGLLVATDGAVARLGHDVRRLRPNLLLAGVGPDEERTWPGRALEVGDAVVGVQGLRGRCVVTTVDPDTGEQDLEVLRRIRREFDLQLALDCWVVRPGRVRVGDRVRVVDLEASPVRSGGWVVGAPYDVP